MRRLIFLIVFAGLQGISHAIMFQNNGSVIKGKVTDINGSPLAGAGVTIETHSLECMLIQKGTTHCLFQRRSLSVPFFFYRI